MGRSDDVGEVVLIYEGLALAWNRVARRHGWPEVPPVSRGVWWCMARHRAGVVVPAGLLLWVGWHWATGARTAAVAAAVAPTPAPG